MGFFRRRLFFGCFLVFFGVFFDLNLTISIFFDDFLVVYSLIFLGFSLSHLKRMVFCYDIFWKFFRVFRFYLREFEARLFFGFFVFFFFFFFFFFFLKKKKKKKKKKSEIEKPLLQSINLVKVVRFLISPKKKRVKIEVNKTMNPAFLLGTAFNIAYWIVI